MPQPILASSGEYFSLATKIHALTITEMESVQPSHLPAMYPKFVVMYEFFRLIRGEAFLDLRPSDAEQQPKLYAMEDEIGKKLTSLQQQLDPNDPSIQFHIDEMKRAFDLAR